MLSHLDESETSVSEQVTSLRAVVQSQPIPAELSMSRAARAEEIARGERDRELERQRRERARTERAATAATAGTDMDVD